MAVIWGLDLKEMQWGKFKSSYMFGNTDYHLRRTKFVVYQMAMIFCVVSESLGTAALSDYIDQQNYIKNLDDRAIEYNNDYVGVGSYNIFVGIYVATIFGSGFFFDLFWPERKESPRVKIAWRVCSVIACFLIAGAAIAETVIVSSKSAYVTGVGSDRAEELLRQYGGSPLKYSHNVRAVASLVFAWVGFPSVIASTIIMWKSLQYIDQFGPFSAHVNKQKEPQASSDEELGNETKMDDIAPAVTYPTARVEPEQPASTTVPNTVTQPPGSNTHEPIRVYQGT